MNGYWLVLVFLVTSMVSYFLTTSHTSLTTFSLVAMPGILCLQDLSLLVALCLLITDEHSNVLLHLSEAVEVDIISQNKIHCIFQVMVSDSS
jgi:hypothetical protein